MAKRGAQRVDNVIIKRTIMVIADPLYLLKLIGMRNEAIMFIGLLLALL